MTAQPNRSLGHSLEVLHALCGAEEPVGSRELARQLDMEPTRVNRLLGTMALLGLAERTADRRYRPGPAVHVLAASSLRSSGLLQAALPEIRELLKAGHPTALGVLWRDHVCYLFHGKPNQPLERGLGGHQLYPATWSSIGTMLLAMKGDTHPEIRRQGWAWVVPPHGNGGSLAVPVGNPVVAALAIVPTAGANADHAALADVLMAAAKRITATLANAGG